MVGVPGKSKGCNTCIQRKIRCDQAIPLCGNCLKSNRICTGYKRKLGYVFSQNMTIANSAEAGRDDTTVSHQGRWRKTNPKQISAITCQAKEPLSLGGGISSGPALLQQAHCIFLNDYLPAELLVSGQAKQSVPGVDWLLQIKDIAIQTPALEASIMALCTVRVGRKNNDVNLIHQSRAIYTAGLERLRQALNDPIIRLSDETLAACMALMFYELTEGPVSMMSVFAAHRRGAVALLELRGPDASASPFGHSLFLSLRTEATIGALMWRRDTFLSRPEWMEKPWKLLPKSPIDQLLDSFFELRPILLQLDMLDQETNEIVRRDGLRDIVPRTLKVESAIRDRYAKFENSISGPLFWSEFSTLESSLDNTESGKVFPVSFHFPTLSVAQVLTTYWSGMMTVHLLLFHTYKKLAAMESTPPNASSPNDSSAQGERLLRLRSIEHNEQWIAMARNICQSTEYFLQNEMGVLGALNMLVLLAGCNNCFKNFPKDWKREIDWIIDWIRRIKKRCNFADQNILKNC